MRTDRPLYNFSGDYTFFRSARRAGMSYSVWEPTGTVSFNITRELSAGGFYYLRGPAGSPANRPSPEEITLLPAE